MKKLSLIVGVFLLILTINSCKKEEVTTGTVEDFEGNIYKTIKIGDQWWMDENLKSTKNKTGGTITEITGTSSWSTDTYGAFCWYDNDINNKDEYGALYNFYVARTDLCPVGWHVPSNDDWVTLRGYLGNEYTGGGLLKETGTEHWGTPNEGATNSTGFSARGSGYRLPNGVFEGIRASGSYWTSTVLSTDVAGAWHLDNTSSWIGASAGPYKTGLSVRCIKD